MSTSSSSIPRQDRHLPRRCGLDLLYDLLLRAKFGDGYEKPLLISPWLAALLNQLDQALPDDGQWFPEKPASRSSTPTTCWPWATRSSRKATPSAGGP
jgi:hypothetical protein